MREPVVAMQIVIFHLLNKIVIILKLQFQNILFLYPEY